MKPLMEQYLARVRATPPTHNAVFNGRLSEPRWVAADGNTMLDADGIEVGQLDDGSGLYHRLPDNRTQPELIAHAAHSGQKAEQRPHPLAEALGIGRAMVEPTVQPGDWLASLDSTQRKECAVSRGFFAYFPDAIALVARHSVRMNEKHNPGQPVHWSRNKSSDQPDCELRHAIATAIDPDARDADGAYEMVCKAWRAFADLQLWAEKVYARDGKID